MYLKWKNWIVIIFMYEYENMEAFNSLKNVLYACIFLFFSMSFSFLVHKKGHKSP